MSPRKPSEEPPVGVERGTYHPASPAGDATRTHARPADLRAEVRALRSAGNRSAHAARQAATELRRAAGRLDVDDPHREQLLALAEHNAAYADAWEAQRPAVPTIPERRQGRRGPRPLTARGPRPARVRRHRRRPDARGRRLRPRGRHVPPSAPMTAHARPMPTPDAELEAERDRARTERLLEQTADDDLDEHRARQAAGPLGTATGRIARGAW